MELYKFTKKIDPVKIRNSWKNNIKKYGNKRWRIVKKTKNATHPFRIQLSN